MGLSLFTLWHFNKPKLQASFKVFDGLCEIIVHCYVESNVWKSCSQKESVSPKSILQKWNGVQACNTVTLPFFYSDRWCGQFENFGEGHNSQDVTERPCLHLCWLSTRAAETTSDWASLITTYINFTHCVCACVSRSNRRSTLSSSRPKGQTAAQSASCQIYNLGETLRHILTVS